ncbi:hypothetical protein CK203_022561 [Vitis vinifera]|uniref:Uncharacterized protein n=1 Tax=Vitis vinifera TaxID=29760 RepID=A0A438JEL9_VITVI|nr:hypothetical protein CK203_022561 [Vitis vinifera]
MHTVQEKGKFPSQPQQNPRRVHEIGEKNENFAKVDEVKAIITLRGGKQVDQPVPKPKENKGGEQEENVKEQEKEKEVNEDDRPKKNEIVNEEVKKKDKLLSPSFPKALQSRNVVNNATEIFEVLKVSYQFDEYWRHICKKALLDLGASVNLLPYSVYKLLGLRELKLTSITLSLANRSIKILRGMIEDVLVQVDKFYYPVDFIILDTEPIASEPNHVPIILEERVEGIIKEEMEKAYKEFEEFELEEKVKEANEIASINHPMQWRAKEKPLPLINDEEAKKEESPKLNLKPFPSDLTYVYLEEDKYLMVISSKLSYQRETSLLEVLRKCKETIRWSIYDLKGISPLVCTHHIYLEENAKPIHQPQRQLNPHMQEVVRNKVLKLLQGGIIYSISDSTWVSPTQVVPKMSRVTMIQNEKKNLFPQN